MKHYLHTYLSRLWPLSCAWLLLISCNKDKGSPAGITLQKNGIPSVAYNNVSLFDYYTALTATGYIDSLGRPGPFTILAPSNDAFTAAGYSSGADVIRAADSMHTLLPYLIFDERVALDSMPLGFDQPLPTSTGKDIYVTHWFNQRDSAVLVNGVRVSTLSRPASNGLVNVLDGLIYPPVFKDVREAVSGDPSLTLFNAALIHSGYGSTLESGGPYTLFAPSNTAFAALGIKTTDSIYKMDPALLLPLIKAHVVEGRHFIYDYIMKADVTTNTYTEQMEDGSSVVMTLLADYVHPGRFTGLVLTPSNTATYIYLTRSNVLAGNGVVHSINAPLKTVL